MMSTRGCPPRSAAAARARLSARSAVSSSPATPRTPSVPNRRRVVMRALALAELRTLARLLEAGLLALLRTRVAREEAPALELATEVGVGLEQRARDAVAQGAGLGAHAAAVHPGDDIHAVLVADGLQRLADRALEGRAREEVVHRLAVDRVRAVAGLEDDARLRGLALAGRLVGGTRGEVDGGLGDGLVGQGVGILDGLAVLVELLVVGRAIVVAVHDDVDLEVGAGDLRAHAWSGGLLLV